MKRSILLLATAITLAAAGDSLAQLRSNRISAKPYQLNELVSQHTVPEGFKIASQRWIPLQGEADGRPYNGGTVFVITARPGVVAKVLWTITYINWEKQEFRQHDRVYVVEFEGKVVDLPPDPVDPVDPVDDKITAIVYVFEKDDQIVPRDVSSALKKKNETGILATAVDQDIVDGDGDVPDQYKEPIKIAREKGLPCLVVKRGREWFFIKDPKARDIEAL